jgi:hypothetical protein
MSRDFLLVLSGGVVSLVTTLAVLFITDWVYRRDRLHQSDKTEPVEPLKTLVAEKENTVS